MTQIEAATIVIETITAMAQEGRPLMQRVLPDTEVLFWEHFPDDDARDTETRSRWYYHVHAPGDRDPAEHGHFHLFLHRTQLNQSAVPLVIPEEGEDALAHVTHIAGLSVDHSGIPITWFVTNRWVTDEFMYPAETLIAHLDRYDVDQTPEDPAVNRFLTAMVALYRDEIASMLIERDEKLAAILAAENNPTIYERGNDVLAFRTINLDEKIESLDL